MPILRRRQRPAGVQKALQLVHPEDEAVGAVMRPEARRAAESRSGDLPCLWQRSRHGAMVSAKLDGIALRSCRLNITSTCATRVRSGEARSIRIGVGERPLCTALSDDLRENGSLPSRA